ncbi:MAG: hypothetical protein KC561_19670, partial [Myxococcales bacterium]|nr:hypothetical protein [Myxococcales bacterium]
MRIPTRLALAVIVILTALGCATTPTTRSISSAQLGTPYARLTGYMTESGSEEEVPGSVPHDAVRDEARRR